MTGIKSGTVGQYQMQNATIVNEKKKRKEKTQHQCALVVGPSQFIYRRHLQRLNTTNKGAKRQRENAILSPRPLLSPLFGGAFVPAIEGSGERWRPITKSVFRASLWGTVSMHDFCWEKDANVGILCGLYNGLAVIVGLTWCMEDQGRSKRPPTDHSWGTLGR